MNTKKILVTATMIAAGTIGIIFVCGFIYEYVLTFNIVKRTNLFHLFFGLGSIFGAVFCLKIRQIFWSSENYSNETELFRWFFAEVFLIVAVILIAISFIFKV